MVRAGMCDSHGSHRGLESISVEHFIRKNQLWKECGKSTICTHDIQGFHYLSNDNGDDEATARENEYPQRTRS